jgi:hypothetical protein
MNNKLKPISKTIKNGLTYLRSIRQLARLVRHTALLNELKEIESDIIILSSQLRNAKDFPSPYRQDHPAEMKSRYVMHAFKCTDSVAKAYGEKLWYVFVKVNKVTCDLLKTR